MSPHLTSFDWSHSSFLVALALLLGAHSGKSETVPIGYRYIAREANVPAGVLYAIALTESGRAIGPRRSLRPWPWSLNVGGQSYVFDTLEDARAAIQRFQAQGKRSIDIGLMQINWKYHADRFSSPYAALEPYVNLRVATCILRDCYHRHHDWWKAVGCYHAPGTSPQARERADRYRTRVQRHWQQLSAR